MYYPCSENKGADQLCSYCTADLRLCFRLCKLLVYSCGGSYVSDAVLNMRTAHSAKYEEKEIRNNLFVDLFIS